VAAISTKAPTTSGFDPLGAVWFDADGDVAKSGSCQDYAFSGNGAQTRKSKQIVHE
jgi:hypothetical protein